MLSACSHNLQSYTYTYLQYVHLLVCTHTLTDSIHLVSAPDEVMLSREGNESILLRIAKNEIAITFMQQKKRN